MIVFQFNPPAIVSVPDLQERTHNKETERFKLLDVRLNNAERIRKNANDRMTYRYWTLEILIIIEQFTVKKLPTDNSDECQVLTLQSKARITRLRALQRSIE